MAFWKENMPRGMFLRSTKEASNIAAPQKGLSLITYLRARGGNLVGTTPIEDFVAYGEWFLKQVAPTLDRRFIQTLARGMEFGVSPMPESRREMIDRGKLFGVPTFHLLRAKARTEVEYWVLTWTTDSVPESLEVRGTYPEI